MALYSIKNQFSYPVYATLLFSIFSFSHALIEADRFAGAAKPVFVAAKLLFGIAGFYAGYEYWRRPDRDWISVYFFTVTVVYSIFFMWLAPLYEVAYLQCAIGCAFIRVQNRNLFVYIFGLGLLGIYATYFFQDRMGWTVPPAARVDWLFITIIFFLLTWMIQKYAVRAFRNQEDRLSRLSLVGTEASILLREVEARLQTPLDLAHSATEEEMAGLLQTIQAELKVAQTTLKSFRATTGLAGAITEFDLIALWSETLDRLRSRLKNVEVSLPKAQAIVTSDREILRSVFFNLLLNSIEFAEAKQRAIKRLEISWRDGVLSYSDGGKISSVAQPAADRGMGLNIIREDLKRLGIDFSLAERNGESVTGLKFTRP